MCGVQEYRPGHFFDPDVNNPFVPFARDCGLYRPGSFAYYDNFLPAYNGSFHGLNPLTPQDYTPVGGVPSSTVYEPYELPPSFDNLDRLIFPALSPALGYSRNASVFIHPHPITLDWRLTIGVVIARNAVIRRYDHYSGVPQPLGTYFPPDTELECEMGWWPSPYEVIHVAGPLSPEADYNLIDLRDMVGADSVTYKAPIDCANHFSNGAVITLTLDDTGATGGMFQSGLISTLPNQIEVTVGV